MEEPASPAKEFPSSGMARIFFTSPSSHAKFVCVKGCKKKQHRIPFFRRIRRPKGLSEPLKQGSKTGVLFDLSLHPPILTENRQPKGSVRVFPIGTKMPRLAQIACIIVFQKKCAEMHGFLRCTFGIDPPEWQSGLVSGPDWGVGDEVHLGGLLRRMGWEMSSFLIASVLFSIRDFCGDRGCENFYGLAGKFFGRLFMKNIFFFSGIIFEIFCKTFPGIFSRTMRCLREKIFRRALPHALT
ncbi:MAG: hypothetical protein WC598_10110 [Methanoregula sp.]